MQFYIINKFRDKWTKSVFSFFNNLKSRNLRIVTSVFNIASLPSLEFYMHKVWT